MEQHATLDIDVTVSQELRDIMASQRLLSGGHAFKGHDMAVTHAESEKSNHTSGVFADYLILQRHGQRPIKFVGLPIVTFRGSTDLSDIACEWEVQLSISATDTPFISIALTFPKLDDARPLFLAQAVNVADRMTLSHPWSSDIRTALSAAKPLSHIIATDTEINRAFHEITHHCFRSAQHMEERNTQ